MTKDEAWTLLRRHAIEKPSFDMFPAAPYIEAFDQEPADSPLRPELMDAMWTLLVEGDEGEKTIAGTFLTHTTALSEERVRRLAELYLQSTGTEHTIFGRVLSGEPLPSDLQDRLIAEYSADPVHLAELTGKLVTPNLTEALWDAMLRLVTETLDPHALRTAFSIARAYEREMELALLLRSKPEIVLREAARLGPSERFLEVCGLTAD